eukprot:scaffold99988_cov41-Tisochrysis_lutea.AAC.2
MACFAKAAAFMAQTSMPSLLSWRGSSCRVPDWEFQMYSCWRGLRVKSISLFELTILGMYM